MHPQEAYGSTSFKWAERSALMASALEAAGVRVDVKTAAEADLLKERIAAGEDMGALADEHTLRVAGKGAKGRFHIHAHEQPFYRELIDAVRAGAVGRLQGPIDVTAQAAQVASPITPSASVSSVAASTARSTGPKPGWASQSRTATRSASSRSSGIR